jgi:hypothetical protein
MKRPRAHEINDVARGWFNVRLPREWARNEQFSDHGIDFSVELAKTQDLSGITFLVQLKGKEEATLKRDGTFAVPIERKNAKYYVEKVRQPVFLVLVDLEAETAYWLFIQEYLENLGKTKNWQSKSSVVICVPKANVLANTAQLEAAVMAAHRYMAPKIVRFREKSLQALDSRFEVQVRQSSTLEEVFVRPLVPVKFKLFVSNDQTIRRKVERFVEEGLPAEFLPGEVRLEGSLLLEELFKKGVIIQPGHSVEGAIILSALSANGDRLSEPLIVPARVTAGTKVASFDAGWSGAPLRIATSTTFYAERSDVGIHFDIKKWHDCDIRLLPHFERIYQFLKHADSVCGLEMQLEVNGNQLVRGVSADGDFSYFKQLSKYLELLRKARFLASRYSLDYETFRRLTPAECDDIEELYDLLTIGEHRYKVVSGKVGEATFSQDKWEEYQRQAEQDVEEMNRLKIEAPATVVCSMLGEKITLECVASEYTFLKANSVGTESDGTVRSTLQTTASSEHVLRLGQNEPQTRVE